MRKVCELFFVVVLFHVRRTDGSYSRLHSSPEGSPEVTQSLQWPNERMRFFNLKNALRQTQVSHGINTRRLFASNAMAVTRLDMV